MALHIDPNAGTLTITKAGSNKATVLSLPELGWDLAHNVSFAVELPCFTGNMTLPVDLLLQDDDGQAMALVISGIPMEDEKKLRTVADLYGNSAKRQFGVRPAVYFVDGTQCKAAYSLLGTFQTNPQLMKKDVFREFIASHNLQEEIVFRALLQDGELAKQFLTGTLNSEHINGILAKELEKAKQTGFFAAYNALCPTEEDKKALPKQAVLLGGLGEEQYIRFTKAQVQLLGNALTGRAMAILQQGLEQNTWLPLPTESTMESRLTDWAFHFFGWDRTKNVTKNDTIPCYLEPNMTLLADYAFLDPKGNAIAVVITDTLNLSKEKLFVTAEFYGRSIQAKHGIHPFLFFVTKQGTFLKRGAMSGGLEPVKTGMHKMQLAAQVACINVTESRAWNDLLPHVSELRSISNEEARFQKQMEYINHSVEETTKLLSDEQFLADAFTGIMNDTALPEEDFWKKLLGEERYLRSRKEELRNIRTFVADKRIAAEMLS